MRLALLPGIAFLASLPAAQVLTDPSVGTLELVTPISQAGKLDLIDGLAFDRFGNLLGALEISGPAGGVVSIATGSGLVTPLFQGFSRVDQLDLDLAGQFFGTREVAPSQTFDRLLGFTLAYDSSDHPLASGTVATGLVTLAGIDHPEGLVVLKVNGDYGPAGTLLVGEDKSSGRLLKVGPGGTVTVLASGLARPEGMAFGSFNGALAPALYVAETSNDRVRRVAANGTLTTLGLPGAVALTNPDNLEFGPDGYLYVSEDRVVPDSRIVRISASGTHTVFATGFGQAAGLAFDPTSHFLYIAEQDFDRVWRVRFTDTIAPTLTTPGTIHAVRTTLAGTTVVFHVSASDNFDPRPTVTCRPASGSLFPPGRTAVECRASDDNGNVTSSTFEVFVHTVRPR